LKAGLLARVKHKRSLQNHPGIGIMAAHKPSERFMRKPLKARSKASHSERVRVADLVNKLVKKPANDDSVNEQTQFGGYKPSEAGPPA
jgi:hypothetical protein